jgi:hypothetical protein
MSMNNTYRKNWNMIPSNGEFALRGVLRAIKAEHTVIMIVNIDSFRSGIGTGKTPNHFIQVTKVTGNDDDTINVHWWSWGANQEPIKMTRDQFKHSIFSVESYE